MSFIRNAYYFELLHWKLREESLSFLLFRVTVMTKAGPIAHVCNLLRMWLVNRIELTHPIGSCLNLLQMKRGFYCNVLLLLCKFKLLVTVTTKCLQNF